MFNTNASPLNLSFFELLDFYEVGKFGSILMLLKSDILIVFGGGDFLTSMKRKAVVAAPREKMLK